MLTGESKKIYQRNYMREYMRVKRGKSVSKRQVVKTQNINSVKTPMIDADGYPVYDD